MNWVWFGLRFVRAREDVRKGERVSEREVVDVYLADGRDVAYSVSLNGPNIEDVPARDLLTV
jgi:hypothetical protein